jgi:restriction system protein
MLPLLNLAADGEEHRLRDAIEELADYFNLTEDERKELLPSGSQATFDNRVGWARTYMKKAGLLKSPRRGYFQITDEGLPALKQKPEMINVTVTGAVPGVLGVQDHERYQEHYDGDRHDGADRGAYA